MKQPIAMRCTKEQFKSIKPKLKKVSEIGKLSGAFKEYPYLTNNYKKGTKLIFDFIGNDDLWQREHQNNIHEEWNEKIFLEACGIEVENSKHPSLEEVKEYFKNAKTLKSYIGRIFELGNIVKGVDMSFKNAETGDTVYNDETGEYAEILTYKEKTFSITESQIKTLNDIFEVSEAYQGQDYLKEWFADAFKSEVKLEAGKWYKSLDHPKWMFCITEIIEKAKRVKGFGFGADGLWMENIQDETWEFYEFERCPEATEQEVFEALKNEAVKRGYKNNNFVKDIIMSGEVQVQGEHYEMNKKYGFMMGDSTIFKDGVWAELETISINEAEKMLGKKIIQ